MKTIFILVLFMAGINLLSAQIPAKSDANYDESKVPAYILPDPLVFADGSRVASKDDWTKRRNEIIQLFREEVYGFSPEWEGKMEVTEISHSAVYEGTATRKEIRLRLKNEGKELDIWLLLYVPLSVKPAPVFIGYNFYGNHTITSEKDITLPASWLRNNAEFHISENKATEASRGVHTSRWPVKEILERGYGVGTIYYGDLDPDFDDGFINGVHGLFGAERDSSSWGSIAAWAWGLSRVLDYLETDPDVDSKKVISIGHSRLGKTSLWAGACDERFAIVISNNSGCGGAALSRRKFGETVHRINKMYPHWFCMNFNKYNDNEEMLPVDQHQLVALIAPRPVYVASATEDLWCDPRGEFLSAKNAEPVYRLFGLEGLGISEFPEPESPAGNYIGYHLRNGKHDITLYDWTQYLNFADRHFKK
ncbi:MAG: hypothetical protein AB2L24_18705 [Mangrovibacterium sp.]